MSNFRPRVAMLVGFLLGSSSLTSYGASTVAKWTTHGPYGMTVTGLTLGSHVLYAFDGRRIFRSTDGAESWNRLSDVPVAEPVVCLAADPRAPIAIIYAGTNGLYRTIDGGSSWTPVSSLSTGSPGYGPTVTEIHFDPANSSILYVVTDFGILKSYDEGLTWTRLNAPNATTVAIDSNDPAVLYAGTSDLLKSLNGGVTWTRTGVPPETTGGGISAIAVDPSNSSVLYAARYYGLFKSIDAGVVWTHLPLRGAAGFHSLAIDSENSSVIYAATDTGLFRSSDGGLSWAVVRHNSPNRQVKSMVSEPETSTAYAGWPDGVFKSSDAGRTWTDVNAGIPTLVGPIAVDFFDSETVYVGASAGHGLYKSFDSGTTWTPSDVGLLGSSVSALATDSSTPGVLYAGGLGNVFASVDGGVRWTGLGGGFSYVVSLLVDPLNSSTLFAGTYNIPGPGGTPEGGGVSRSIDRGQTWVWTPDLRDRTVMSIVSDPSGVLYAGTSSGAFRSSSGGDSWIDLGFATGIVPVVRVDPKTPTTLYACSDQGVWKSIDRGDTWTLYRQGLTNTGVRALVIDPLDANTIYAGTDGGGVFRSDDGAKSWNPLNDGLTDLDVFALAIDSTGTFLHAATGEGVFDISLSKARTPVEVLRSRLTPIRVGPR